MANPDKGEVNGLDSRNHGDFIADNDLPVNRCMSRGKAKERSVVNVEGERLVRSKRTIPRKASIKSNPRTRLRDRHGLAYQCHKNWSQFTGQDDNQMSSRVLSKYTGSVAE